MTPMHPAVGPRPVFERLESRRALAADLVVEAVTAPGAAEYGGMIELSWVVRNAGDAAAELPLGWHDAIYLSRDAVLDETDLFLGTGDYGEPALLAPGETYESVSRFFLDLGYWAEPGTFHVIIEADGMRAVEESDDANNALASAPVEFTVPPLADLVVESVQADRGAALFGDTLTLTWTVRNVGPGEAAAPDLWYDALYLSTDAAFDYGDMALEIVELDARPSGPLAPGASFQARAVVRLPLGVGPGSGDFHFIVAADENSAVYEQDESNNTLASAPVSIAQPPPPDLVVEAVAAEPAGEFGRTILVRWTVRNIGAGPAPLWWGDGFHLSLDAMLDGGDRPLDLGGWSGGSGAGVVLAAGESMAFEASVALPLDPNLAPGTYFIIVRADEWQSVGESDESNNAAASDPVSIGVPVPIDLAVESGSAPSAGELGQGVELSWLVRNLGPGAAENPGWFDGVYLSLDDRLGPEDLLIGAGDPSSAGVVSLRVGESYLATAVAYLPQDGTLLPGTYHVIVAAGEGGGVYEVSTANNALALGVIEVSGTIIPPDPGLGGGPLYGFEQSGTRSDAGGPDAPGPSGRKDEGRGEALLFQPAGATGAPAFAAIDAAADPGEPSPGPRRAAKSGTTVLRVRSAVARPVVVLRPSAR